MAKWTVAKAIGECGYCICVIPQGDPVLLIASYVRCMVCAQREGYQPDEAAIAEARRELKAALDRAKAEAASPVSAGTNQPVLPLDRPRGFQQLADFITDKRLPTGDRE